MQQQLGEFLDAIASRETAPGGGAVAATTVAMAAGLVAMAARFSEGQLEGASAAATHADQLRARAAPLAERDGEAYAQVSAAYALPRDAAPEDRRERIRQALRGAAEVPIEIACVAAEVAEGAAQLARDGNKHLRGDAITALLMSDASARSAASLVRINVDAGELEDTLIEEARGCVRAVESHIRDTPGGGGTP